MVLSNIVFFIIISSIILNFMRNSFRFLTEIYFFNSQAPSEGPEKFQYYFTTVLLDPSFLPTSKIYHLLRS